MRLTKYEHACVLLEDTDTRLLIDPGGYSHGFEELTDLTGILITHQHADHIDVERFGPLIERNPEAALYADEGTAAILAEQGFSVTTAREGDRLDFGLEVTVHGVNHAVIHPDIPMIPNVGYLVGGRFFHPGDAFTVPHLPVDVLGLPTAAPWLKVAEAVDYLRDVAPRVAIPIHEAVLARPALHYGLFERLSLDGTTVTVVPPGDSIKL